MYFEGNSIPQRSPHKMCAPCQKGVLGGVFPALMFHIGPCHFSADFAETFSDCWLKREFTFRFQFKLKMNRIFSINEHFFIVKC